MTEESKRNLMGVKEWHGVWERDNYNCARGEHWIANHGHEKVENRKRCITRNRPL